MVVNQKILREIIKKNFQADIREAGMFPIEGVDLDLFGSAVSEVQKPDQFTSKIPDTNLKLYQMTDSIIPLKIRNCFFYR